MGNSVWKVGDSNQLGIQNTKKKTGRKHKLLFQSIPLERTDFKGGVDGKFGDVGKKLLGWNHEFWTWSKNRVAPIQSASHRNARAKKMVESVEILCGHKIKGKHSVQNTTKSQFRTWSKNHVASIQSAAHWEARPKNWWRFSEGWRTEKKGDVLVTTHVFGIWSTYHVVLMRSAPHWKRKLENGEVLWKLGVLQNKSNCGT